VIRVDVSGPATFETGARRPWELIQAGSVISLGSSSANPAVRAVFELFLITILCADRATEHGQEEK